jgi:hypothetical protein
LQNEKRNKRREGDLEIKKYPKGKKERKRYLKRE